MDCMVQNNIPLQLLEEITDGFSERRMIGSGSSGKVYKGVHKDGKKVAVKLLYGMPGLNDDQFQNEFNYLKRLDHQNIVRLVGCCNETKEKLVNHMGKLVLAEKRYTALCLEYMHNGSLDNYISDEYSGHSWSTCYKIIKGICEGLKYLHEELKPPIYHLDLKPANVLLDINMLPKISDFGLSKLFGEEQTQFISNDRGTDAYSPPEYKKRGIVSMMFDIFSLGVVIMKIMAGRVGYCRSHDISSQQFIQLVHGNWRNRLQERSNCGRDMEIYSAQIKTCIEIAVSCVEYDRHKRPKIGDIVNKLNEMEENVLLKITKVSNLFRRATNVPRTLASESATELVSKRILVPESARKLVLKQILKRNVALESTEKFGSKLTSYIRESFFVATGEFSGDSWSTRYKIIKGICEGLTYRHGVLKPPIYRLDLKPANVLLDENMLPKIANFGLSKLFGEKQTQMMSNDRGIDAYSPLVSRMFDILSLGVVIVKILAGRTGYCRSPNTSSEELIELVHGNWRNMLQERSIHGMEIDIYYAQTKTCIEITVSCVEYDRNKSTKIGDIINELNEMEKNVLLKITKVSSLFRRATNVLTILALESVTEHESKWTLVQALNSEIELMLKQKLALESTVKLVSKLILALEKELIMGQKDYSGSADMSSQQFQHVQRNRRNRPTPAEDRRWSGKMRHMNSSSASSYTLMRNWKY